MTVFIWMYIALAVIGAISVNLPKTTARKFAWLSGFFILYLILALRAPTVGTDLRFYIPHFEANGNSYIHLEPGFEGLSLLLYRVSTGSSFFLAFTAFLSIFPVSLLFRDYSKSIVFSYIIFSSFVVYHFMFSGIRQAIAIGFIAIAFNFMFRKKLVPFIGAVLLASTFHVSSIIAFVAYPLCNWVRMTNFKYVILCIIGLSAVFALKPILDFILPLLFDDGKYAHYVDQDTMPAYNLFILIFAFFLFTFAVRQPGEMLLKYRMLLYCALMCQSLGFLSQSATRIGYYFLLSLPLAIPEVIAGIRTSDINRKLITSGIVAFMIFFFFYAYGGGYLEVVPYSFNWD